MRTWLSEDPLLDVDSPNLYAFVAWQPSMGADPMGECLWVNDTPCLETAKSVGGMVVGTLESGASMTVGLATAPVMLPYREIKRGMSEMERIYDAYQEGGFETAVAEDLVIRRERAEMLISLVPGVNTYRQGKQILRTYEQQGSFAGGRQVGRTTFSLAMDATVVYGATRAARTAVLGEGMESAAGASRLKTAEMSDMFRGEELGQVSIFKGRRVPYLSETERLHYQLRAKGGKLYDASGNLFDTGEGSALYVMDSKGRLFARTFSLEDDFHHSSFVAGEPVAGAGLMRARNGRITMINDRSGHYRPSPEIFEQVIDQLEKGGVDVPK